LVGLSCDPLRLLGSDVAVGEPGVEVAGIELHLPLPPDDFGDPACGPEVSGVAERPRTLEEPSQNGAFLTRREFAGPSGRRLGLEALGAALLEGGLPTADGPQLDAEEVGDVLGGVAFGKALDCEKATLFEFGCRAGGYHAQWYACPLIEWMIL